MTYGMNTSISEAFSKIFNFSSSIGPSCGELRHPVDALFLYHFQSKYIYFKLIMIHTSYELYGQCLMIDNFLFLKIDGPGYR